MLASIKSVAVVGAGTMGQGIAISCAQAGYKTLLFDINTDFCKKAYEQIGKALQQAVAKGKLTQQAFDEAYQKIQIVEKAADVKADLIIEAIIENLDVKRKLFKELEQVNASNSILATNTSSISVTQIAEVLQHPGRFVGLHFFNPAHLMKLVEVISGQETEAGLIPLLKDFCVKLGKTAVEVKDSPGFIVNRVARHYYVESLKLLEDGVASHETIDALLRSAGFKMGAFELMDLIGMDVNYAVTTSVYEGFGKAEKFKPSEIQHQKIKDGKLGRKTGKGFYEY